MATKAKFIKQFSYANTANLVLSQEHRSKPTGESSEVESLWGKLDGVRMGDRYAKPKIVDLEQRVQKAKTKRKGQEEEEILDLERSRRRATDVLAATERLEQLGYRPKTKETKAAYEILLSLLQRSLGEQPRDVMRNVSEEVLTVLKNDAIRDADRRNLIEESVGKISDDEFAQFISVGKRITDFSSENEEATGDEEKVADVAAQGVSVLFQKEDEEDEEGGEGDFQMMEDQDVDTAAGMAADAAEDERMGEIKGTDDDDIGDKFDHRALSKMLSEFYQNDDVRQRLVNDIWEVLAEPGDDRLIENKLVVLLGYDKFDVISKLMRRRALVNAPAQKQANDPLSKAHQLDLESLSFVAGAHTMTNRKCHLPPGTKTVTQKNYEMVIVPALARKRLGDNERLVDVLELPVWAQKAFPNIKTLNRVQSRVYHQAFHEHNNFLMCAPTGAGKTNVALLAMLHEIGLHTDDDGNVDLDAFKIIYVAPMKALVQEMVRNFGEKLAHLGITVRELSGDAQLSKQQIQETQLIITTPEKWDIITRKSGERTYTQTVKLLIIDEIHLLHDDRGPVIESLVARTMRQIESTQAMIRFVGLSATLPNYDDVALLLRVEPENVFFFDNSYRPCPLEQRFLGITEKKALKRMQLMNDLTYEHVMDYAGQHQVLVFVHSRKETAKTARAIRDAAVQHDTLTRFLENDGASREVLVQAVDDPKNPVKNQDLRELLPYGFGIHHAGLSRSDRELVESLFSQKHIKVLVSTATLAWGVNLPAHAVIIKGTKIYSPEKGAWVELSPLDVMQMMGRAGRPGFDDFGEGMIITGHTELQYYLSLLNQQLPIESQYVKQLANNLNAEIVLGTVSSVADAAQWLTYTYLYIRMLKNPTVYGIPEEELELDPKLEQRRYDLIHSAAMILAKENLIKYDRRTGAFQATDMGRVAAHYYVSHASMATYNSHMKPTMTEIDLFRVFSLSDEFKYLAVREEEKLELAKLSEQVPIPVKEGVEEGCTKINVLLQAYISQLRLEGFALVCDMVYVTQSAGRLLRALYEIALRRGWSSVAHIALNLCKKAERRIWGTMSPLRQLPIRADVKLKVVRKIERTDFPLDHLYDLSAHEIGELIAMPQLGKSLHKLIHQIPRVDVSAHLQPVTPSLLKVDLTVTPDFIWDDKIHNGAEVFWVYVSDGDEETLLHTDQVIIKAQYATDEHYLSFYLPLLDPIPPQYFIRVTSDRWLGSDTVLPLSFKKLIPPAKMLPHTDLTEDIVNIQALECVPLEKCYAAEGVGTFNAVQSHVFESLYMTDEIVMLSAPSGAGKSICAELALMRLWLQVSNSTSGSSLGLGPKGCGMDTISGNGKALYITPRTEFAIDKLVSWTQKFASMSGLEGPLSSGIKMGYMTGDSTSDAKLLTDPECYLVICTPSQYDAVSRKWTKGKVAKVLSNLSLIIADDLHMISDDQLGHVYESVISRARCIAAQLKAPTRFVGLCTSVANATDLAQWLGVSMDPRTLRISNGNVYSFNQTARPVPLETQILTSDMGHPPTRFLSFSKQVFDSLKNFGVKDGQANSVMMFVPTRKQALVQALDIYTYLCSWCNVRSDDESMDIESKKISDVTPFLNIPYADIQDQVETFIDPILIQLAAAGIGMLYEGMKDHDRDIVDALFASGAICVLISSSRMVYSVRYNAKSVFIVDTVRYEGKEHRYVSIPPHEIDLMAGHAGRQGIDSTASVVLFCHGREKEFYRDLFYRPLPVESRLDRSLHDELNAEIVAGTVDSLQTAVDFITWTFYYHRLTKNPNYYNLQVLTPQAVSTHLSELVQSVVDDLRTAACVRDAENEEDISLAPNNLGIIASHYNVHAATVDLFAASTSGTIGIRGLLDVLCAATEFDSIEMRRHEDVVLRKLANRLDLPTDAADAEATDNPVLGRKFNDPHTKAAVLLRAHFTRAPLNPELTLDTRFVLENAVYLLQALVDVLGSQMWLKPALRAMKLSQMCIQAIWNKDSVFRQIPHFNHDMIEGAKAFGLQSVDDILSMPEESRNELLKDLSQNQVSDVAVYCNRYPSVSMQVQVSYEADGSLVSHDIDVESGDLDLGDVIGGTEVTVNAGLSRDSEDDVGSVVAPYYPKPKSEFWWMVVGNDATNSLSSIKRVSMAQSVGASLKFVVPEDAGQHTFNVYFVNDSYLGIDDSFTINFRVSGNKKRDADGDAHESRKKSRVNE